MQFVEEAASFTLSFGDSKDFFGGLEGLVGGITNPDLEDQMGREHCESDDSHAVFEGQNYGVKTVRVILAYWHFPSSLDLLVVLKAAVAC